MMMRIFGCLVFAVVCQLSALAVSGPNATFDCYKSPNSTNTLKLTMRSNGPDTIPQGLALYFFYYTSANSPVQTHVFHAAKDLRRGDIFDVLVAAPASTNVQRCGCSLTPVTPSTEINTGPPERRRGR